MSISDITHADRSAPATPCGKFSTLELAPPDVLSIARAIVRPGGKAMIITAGNRSGGWLTLERAVASGAAFAVEVADDVLALDADNSDRGREAEALARRIANDGYAPVIVASGRPGHRHAFVRVDDHAARARYAAEARVAGIDVRQCIRPPGSPHRLGLPVRIVEPVDVGSVVAALSSAVREHRPLSARMARVLRFGDARANGYASRSEMLMALALAAVAAGWSADEYVTAVLDGGNAAGEKLRTRGAAAAERYLSATWAKAERRAAERPAIRGQRSARAYLARVDAAARQTVWTGRTGASDLATLQAHVGLAAQVGRVMYSADVRSIAERAGLAISTVSTAQRRLLRSGWLARTRCATTTEAAVWSLRPGRLGAKSNTPISSRGGDENYECSVTRRAGGDVTTAAADVWRRGGLGKGAWLVWSALHPAAPTTFSTLREATGRHRSTIRRQLVKLAKHGLATEADGGWRRGCVDVAELERALGVAGERQRQRRRHEDDRERYRARRARTTWPSSR